MSRAKVLFFAYLVFMIALGISPYYRDVWLAENLPMWCIVAGIVWANSVHTFSNTSLLAMSVLIVLHTIGGHFTFERVPFDWVTQIFDFERNHYDRVAHFSVGFYAYPIMEFLLARGLILHRAVLGLFGVFAIVTVAGLYEVVEWLYAVSADPEAGIAVLGSQGDIWDAQKDILADTLGALLAVGLFLFKNPAKK
jgi:putative membrane protein